MLIMFIQQCFFILFYDNYLFNFAILSYTSFLFLCILSASEWIISRFMALYKCTYYYYYYYKANLKKPYTLFPEPFPEGGFEGRGGSEPRAPVAPPSSLQAHAIRG